MIKLYAHNITFVLIFTLFAIGALQNVFAQQPDDEVKSLGEILNPEIDYGNNGEPLTPKFMAKRYYNQCLKTESITMNEKEKEMLCTCTSAKSSQFLDVEDFKALPEKSKAGTKARGKFIAYAYVPCMSFVTESIFRNDCIRSPKIDDIVVGKKKICSCASNRFQDFLRLNEVMVIDQALHEYPMTINPLEIFLQKPAYYSQRDIYIDRCKFEFLYNRQN